MYMVIIWLYESAFVQYYLAISQKRPDLKNCQKNHHISTNLMKTTYNSAYVIKINVMRALEFAVDSNMFVMDLISHA